MSNEEKDCSHNPRYREYYRDGTFKCYDCRRIIIEQECETTKTIQPMTNKYSAVEKLHEYFEQQLRLHRSSEIKYTAEEVLVDAVDVCKNAMKAYASVTKDVAVLFNDWTRTQEQFDELQDGTWASRDFDRWFLTTCELYEEFLKTLNK